jgi:signal transduction histidine kinase
MLKLVEDLLDVSRLGSPMGRIETRPAPLVPVVAEVVDELRALAASREIDLQLRHPAEFAERHATLDAARYGQVIRNVLANAIRFSPPSRPIEIIVSDADGIALTTVRDHGPGIPEDELDEIFEPFVQSSRTRDGSGGTGLGLAICRRIMQAHDGFVTADNDPRGGAIFRIGLRWHDAVPAPVDLPELLAANET